MQDKEIYELVDKKNEDLVDRIEKTLKVQTAMLACETQEIRKSISGLTKKIEKQNNRVNDLEDWKIKNETTKSTKAKILKTTIAIIGLIVSLLAIWSFIKSNNIDTKVEFINKTKTDVGQTRSIPEPDNMKHYNDSINRAWIEKKFGIEYEDINDLSNKDLRKIRKGLKKMN